VAAEDALHKQVYLATYEEPTLAEASTSPRRWLILVAVMVVGFLTWSIITLVYYALRDRR
jgi:capsular polysaccharide transport system permease protein